MIPSKFLFIVCQVGAEPALKKELAREHPELRFAFSRPGFVTFKRESGEPFAADFTLRSVFARAYGVSSGKCATAAELLEAAQSLRADGGAKRLRLHAWERDSFLPGEEARGFEPGARGRALEKELRAAADEGLFEESTLAAVGDLVFDAVWVDEGELWHGFHRHGPEHLPYPGGRAPVEAPADSPSRAFGKLEEAIAWSQAPLRAGDLAVEIGSAPGGASLALLRRGLRVVGIDPAQMSDIVARDPNFMHVCKPISQVMREELPERIDWLLLDMNVAPQVTLYAVDRLASRMKGSLLGVLLTVKLNEWRFADEIPDWVENVRAMGMAKVRATQLAGNRQEIVIYGLTRKGRESR